MNFKRFLGVATLVFPGLLFVAAIGCDRGADGNRSASTEAHGHHGGHAVNLPNAVGIQVEFTLDEARRRIVIYVQSSETHKPYPLAVDALDATFEADGQDFETTIPADPRRDDPQGSSSRFSLSVDKLPQQLLASNDFQLKLSFSAEGRTSAVAIRHSNDHAHEYHHD